MKILHISPTYFSDHSFIGGGERYAYELAKAMALKEEVIFLSFADKKESFEDDTLHIEYIQRTHSRNANPFCKSFVKLIQWADIIHCHQVYTIATDISIILSKLFKKKVFITDLGGGDKFAFSYHLPLHKWSNAFLLISNYSKELWERVNSKSSALNLDVIYGGVDVTKFCPNNGKRSNKALFVGRLLPHKGIDYLVDAIDGNLSLSVLGRVYDQRYFDLLKAKSKGKDIQFCTSADDNELVKNYREALVTVLPSVYRNCYGNHTLYPELLGLTVLESMACGTPVIVSNVASLPEIVEDGVTGFIVPPNNATAISEKINYLQKNQNTAKEMGMKGRERILKQFSWDIVAKRCLEIYKNF